MVDCTKGCIYAAVQFILADVGEGIILLGCCHHFCFFLFESLLGCISCLLLLHNLLDVHVGKLFLDSCLLSLHLLSVEQLALSESLGKTVRLLLLLGVRSLHHLVVIIEFALHEVSELGTHLSLVLGPHRELVQNGLLLGFDFL